MEATQLRHLSWELRKKLIFEKSSVTGMVVAELADMLLKVMEDIECKLGVAECQLQVPGGVLNKDFKQGVEDGLSLLKSFLQGLQQGSKQFQGEGNDALKTLRLVKMMDSKKALVMEEELSSEDDTDKETIVRVLTESDSDKLSVIPMIGMPGTGKTLLVQRVYHERRVFEYFDVKHWVSVSDIRAGPSKLLDQVFKQKTCDIKIQEKFHSVVDGKRYLLILDGVTQGDQYQYQYQYHGVFLHHLLRNVSHGSKVILTASNMASLGNLEPLPLVKDAPYQLEYPSGDEGWNSFKSIAFGYEAAGEFRPENIKLNIAWEIYNKYAGMPRLLKNIAILLHSRGNWEYITDIQLKSIQDPFQTILSKLNLDSYKHISPEIQHCVKYCSLFPEGYEFNKVDLIHLWDAQDYLSTTPARPRELVGDEYFEELHNNGYFFKKNKADTNISVISYLMDSLVNEFIRSVTEPVICRAVDEAIGEANKNNVLHLSFIVDKSEWTVPSWIAEANKLKSLLFLPGTSRESAIIGSIPNIDRVLSKLSMLQALDLAAVNCEDLPEFFGDLNELRYLRLGVSSEYLPESITTLTKLQTLDLRNSNVVVLPRGFHRLVGLKHLYTGDRLMDLPPDFGKLTSLQTLDVFIVGENNKLDALAELTVLVGKLKIRYETQYNKDELKETVGILKNTYLTDISLIWSSSYEEEEEDVDDMLYSCLQPPPSLESLTVCRWKGVGLPQQLVDGFPVLRNLVSLHIEDCGRCKNLPIFSALPHLRFLQLWDLSTLEYIEIGDTDFPKQDYFPSLESLVLANLPLFKGWSRESHDHLNLPRLVKLGVSGCPKLKSMPQLQSLESLEAHYVHGLLLEHIQKSASDSSTLKRLEIVSVHHPLKSFSINSGLESLIIRQCSQLENLIVESSNLKQLEVHDCGKLIDITTGALTHLNLLEKLEIKRCEMLNWLEIKQDDYPDHDDSAWQRLKFIRSLKLLHNSSLNYLPKGFSFLERLEELSLHSLQNLRSIPEWIGNFRQLRRLSIRNCPVITELPDSLGRLSVLEQLAIYQCPRLKQIPESRLNSSCKLDIQDCPKLPRRDTNSQMI
ncbi:disease resistance protein RGA2-like [Spinacia oleracea]|uniref:Disease resistance protein RGA2-like n=1 Tax=Spinacia oleracea TaxID=3562 RepID=A0A9R0K144_SPIOL|nr:disease resistance protein RGA2-like [Spinacia oleracea]